MAPLTEVSQERVTPSLRGALKYPLRRATRTFNQMKLQPTPRETLCAVLRSLGVSRKLVE